MVARKQELEKQIPVEEPKKGDPNQLSDAASAERRRFVEDSIDEFGEEVVEVLALRAVKKAASAIGLIAGVLLAVLGWMGFSTFESREQLITQLQNDLTDEKNRLATQSDKLDKEIADLREKFQPIDDRLDDMEGQSKELFEDVSDAKQQLGDVENRLLSFDQSMARVDATFGSIESARDAVYQFYGQMQRSVDENRLAISDVRSMTQDVESRVRQHATQIASQREVFAAALPTRKSSNFADWPLVVTIGKNSNGGVDLVSFKDHSSNDVGTYHNVSAGKEIAFTFDEHSYQFYVTSIGTGFFDRFVMMSGARVPLR